ncbi:aminoacetone oxidase family FAD-binding enzyme [Neokomagataea tanensis]|uniref:Aminoacetone oxidase family FAD-binding enzyme n=2 Tax=Neokomagataea TaxID=1223423 RepID=A0A4Y6VA02_9PROT|nr:aminoacetone oxidase family FAD-binding enzyme [Neokomagataea tanensis]QDH25758.1 aminoacetone oxidase family FAD-binding enzyme [Neokomagataea tanensis]
MAAAVAGRGGLRVLVLDHSVEPGRKILISGGGRCNFTHLETKPECFLSNNKHFARSALACFTAKDFLAMVDRHRIAWHEKARGQLFCDGSARQIVEMLMQEAEAAHVEFGFTVKIDNVERDDTAFRVTTSAGIVQAQSVVLATGGLSIPKLGASDLSLRLAKSFGLSMVATEPALVPLCLEGNDADLAGVSLPVISSAQSAHTSRKGIRFEDGLVFTHRGISGPAVLQISSYWDRGAAVTFNLAPGRNVLADFQALKVARPRAKPPTLLEFLPTRLARSIVEDFPAQAMQTELANVPDRILKALAERVEQWRVIPSGTEGYAKAEVMRGGIDTKHLSSQTMEARKVPGLFAVGEAVDVTGWLGGHNFQWAWSSGAAAGRGAIARKQGA